MPILGAHQSISGGYYRAVQIAADEGCDCVQIFTKNNNQWRAKPLTDEDVRLFTEAMGRLGIKHPISHDSYLINLGSPDKTLWKKSVDALVIEIERASRLEIPYVVAHPGAFTSSSEAAGIKQIARGINEMHRQTKKQSAQLLLETTAGQGSNLGWQFEQLGAILEKVKNPDIVGVCFDTCHVHAAGYAMATEKEYRATMRKLNSAVGIKKVKAFHLNDSKTPLGSRVDRHEAIGKGHLGLEPFRHLLNDRRFKKVPMYLETPKGPKGKSSWDRANLRQLRKLIED
ncbi:MAG: deoxyribonuclease IV [Planctomycetaceae bacterium]|nr:deoxyribonuclease IV [Planctomycetaceae bacterium]